MSDQDKDAALRLLDEEYQRLRQAVDGLDDAQLTRVWFGDWGVKDIIAHVAGWEREMAGALRRIAAGERPVPEGVDYGDGDAWNAKFALAARPQNTNTILADWHQSHANYVRAATSIDGDRFGEKDGRPTTASRILDASGHGHYQEHAQQILEWRKQEGV